MWILFFVCWRFILFLIIFEIILLVMVVRGLNWVIIGLSLDIVCLGIINLNGCVILDIWWLISVLKLFVNIWCVVCKVWFWRVFVMIDNLFKVSLGVDNLVVVVLVLILVNNFFILRFVLRVSLLLIFVVWILL